MIIKESQKVVDYFGAKLTVPNDDEWIATDKDGRVYCYDSEPDIDDLSSKWTVYGNDAVYLCTVHLDGMDWKDTLMEV